MLRKPGSIFVDPRRRFVSMARHGSLDLCVGRRIAYRPRPGRAGDLDLRSLPIDWTYQAMSVRSCAVSVSISW
jgi:hypothetical protein